MEKRLVSEINKYSGNSVNPMDTPNVTYELYSVPSFDGQYPEIIKGSEIGSSKITVQENDVLICKINPRINRVWVVKHKTEYPLLASSEWIVVRNEEINSEFLKWYFSNPTFRKLMVSQVAGIGGSLTRAQPKQVAKYPVPIPDSLTQYLIAAVLNKVSDLISLRKQQLAKLDDLVKSRFIEMFGDPVTNPMEWEIKDFEGICSLITDGEHATPRRIDKGIYLLSARNILNHSLQLDDVDYIDEEEYARIAKRVIPRENDILISCSGSIGRCCCVPPNIKFQMVRSAALLRFQNFVNPVFVEYLITSEDMQSQIQRSATQSSQANLFQGKIKKLHGYIPPLELQNQFATFVQQVDKSKLAVNQSLEKLETLKKSLMQKYFG